MLRNKPTSSNDNERKYSAQVHKAESLTWLTFLKINCYKLNIFYSFF